MEKIKNISKNKYVKKYSIYAILLAIVTILSLVSLRTSPIYKGVQDIDSSAFQVMAKGLLNNKIMYKDLYDHKGPILYFINYIGFLLGGIIKSLIGVFSSKTPNTNIGIFIIENTLFYLGAIATYKTSRMFLKKKISFLITIFFLYLSYAFTFGGNYTEEYAINIIAIAMLFMIKVLYLNQNNKRNWFIIGSTFMLNFLIKPTYIAIWIAFGLVEVIAAVKNKEIKGLLKNVLWAILGCLIVTTPVFIYLVVNNAINDFINAYFILNMKYSKNTLVEKLEVFLMLVEIYRYGIILVIAIISNLIILLDKIIKRKIKVFITLYFIINLMFAAWAAHLYNHYLLLHVNAIILEVIFATNIIYKNILVKKDGKIYKTIVKLPVKFIYFVTVGLFIFVTIYSGARWCINNKRQIKNGQKQIEKLEELKQYVNKDDDIFVIGNNSYYYLFFNKCPKFKYYFQIPIIMLDQNIKKETLEFIKNENPKLIFVDLREYRGQLKNVYGVELKNILDNKYMHVLEELENNTNMEYYILKNMEE